MLKDAAVAAPCAAGRERTWMRRVVEHTTAYFTHFFFASVTQNHRFHLPSKAAATNVIWLAGQVQIHNSMNKHTIWMRRVVSFIISISGNKRVRRSHSRWLGPAQSLRLLARSRRPPFILLCVSKMPSGRNQSRWSRLRCGTDFICADPLAVLASETLQVSTTISQEAEIRNCFVQQRSCYGDGC